LLTPSSLIYKSSNVGDIPGSPLSPFSPLRVGETELVTTVFININKLSFSIFL